jgi:tetratricopeptide (TPR) repeat protein
MAKAEKESPQPVAGPPTFTDVDKNKARAWFKKAVALRDQRNYDYALECIITGLNFWPDAVEEGHMPLMSLALQRQQAGGKKPGMMDGMKLSMTGKDAKAAMLNAETLLSKDPSNPGYMDGVLKNAAKLDLVETVKFFAPKVLQSLREEKKANPARFKGYREILIEFCDRCDTRGDAATMADLLELAVASVELQLGSSPGDMALRDEQRDLAGKLTISKGKYSSSTTFRDSVLDVDKQTLMQEQEQRGKQAESKLDALVVNARKELAANPGVAGKINALVDLLLKTERKKEEDEAIDVLLTAYQASQNYSFKMRADDIRLRQVARVTRQLKAKAQETGSEDDQQNARLAEMDEIGTEMEVFRERVKNYPTDLRMKYRLGSALFRVGDYDEAIPVLQGAQGDPRNRTRALLMLGRCFHEKNLPGEAAEILKEALESYEMQGDDTHKELLYRLGVSHKAAGNKDEAKAVLGKLLRQDYNYADGHARKLVDELR